MNKTLVTLSMSVFSYLPLTTWSDPAPDFTLLVEKASPVVVNVEVQGTVTNAYGQGIPPDMLEQFFGIPQDALPGYAMPEGRSRIIQGQGSGFIIDQDGYILTNEHVIEGADSVKVQLTNQKEYVAKVVGADKRTDIALLKVDAKALPVAVLGDSDKVKVGDWVLAIGSPFGFETTATKGIVSAIGRSLPSGVYTPFIQTDAAINPGNSGGPLFNSQGEVIAINSQIYSRSGDFNGVGFSIPINMAKTVVEQLKANGKVSRGWLGVQIQNVDQALAESFGMDKPQGALVAAVVPGSPAEKAGLKQGDVILSFNDKQIRESAGLPPLVAIAPIGEKAELTIFRDGKTVPILVTIDNLDSADNLVAGVNTDISSWGMQLKVLDEATRQALNFEGSEGVLISQVSPASSADKSGLRAGDVLLAIGGDSVDTPKAAQLRLQQEKGDRPVPVLIFRQGNTMFLPLLPEKK